MNDNWDFRSLDECMDENQYRYYLTLESPEARQLFIAFCQQLEKETK